MNISKHLVAIPLALAFLAACDGAQESSTLHDQTPGTSNSVAEVGQCDVAAITNWTFYDYCVCVETMDKDSIDNALGLGAVDSMKVFKKIHESKAKAVAEAVKTLVKGRMCLATGLLFERTTGNSNSPIRKALEVPGVIDPSVINRHLSLAQSGITSPQPLVFLNKLGTGSSSALITAVDLSYNKLSDNFFAPLRGIDWISQFGIKDIDLSNNELESTIAVDFNSVVGSGRAINSVDLAYNKIKLFEAWQRSGRVASLTYLNLSHNPEFKAVGYDSNNVEVKLGSAIRKISSDTAELFLDLSDTATDSLSFDDTTRVFSGLNLDNVKIKGDAKVGLRLPAIPSWFTARNSKNIARAISVDSGTSLNPVSIPTAYINVDGATGLDNLQFLKDVKNAVQPQIAYVSAVGSDLTSFSSTPLDLNSIEFFSVDGSSIQNLTETFANLKYASSTGIKDALYLNGAPALEGAVIDASIPCPSDLGSKCQVANANGLGRLPEAGVSKYVDKFCQDTFGTQGCVEAAKGIIGGGVTDTELSKKADEYVQNWCQNTFEKSCELAANVAPQSK